MYRSIYAFAFLVVLLCSGFAQAERSPTGTVDIPPAADRIYGWAYDPDRPDASLAIHVYYGGPAGSGTGKIYTADFARPDVNAAFKINGNHGFNVPFDDAFRTGSPVGIWVYAIDANGNPNVLIGTRTYTVSPPQVAGGKVGILYQIAQSFAWRNNTFGDANFRTMQDVLQDPNLSVGDLYPPVGTGTWPFANPIDFVTQTNPVDTDGKSQLYCFFDGQPNRAPFFNVICRDDRMLAVAKRHVRQLTDLGVDFLLIDNTNAFLDNLDYGSEVTYFRPIEVFFAKWKAAVAAVRAERNNPNLQVPKLAIWGAVPGNSTYHTRMLRLYDDSQYDSVLYRHNGKKVFFYVDPSAGDPNEKRYPSAGVLNEIASHNILPVPMWTHFGPNGFDGTATHKWDFVSPCFAPGSTTRATTSVASVTSCNQFMSTNTPMGSVITATPSYNIPGAVASQAFGSSGRLGGLTLKKQFDAVFARRPDYVFISSWNEHGAGPSLSPSRGRAVGLGDKLPAVPTAQYLLAERMVKEAAGDISALIYFPASPEAASGRSNLQRNFGVSFTDYADLNRQYPVEAARLRYSHYVDDYAAEFSKDLEPTREYGTALYEKAKTLIQLYKSGARSCPATLPACRSASDYRPVAALRDPAGRYWYGPVSAKAPLVSAGYREICAPNAFQSDFCSNPADPYVAQGPFLAYETNLPGTQPLTRCRNTNNGAYWFTANSAECGINPAYRNDGVIGYVAITKSKEMTRVLNRCYKPGGFHFIAVDEPCPVGTNGEGVLGYVH